MSDEVAVRAPNVTDKVVRGSSQFYFELVRAGTNSFYTTVKLGDIQVVL